MVLMSLVLFYKLENSQNKEYSMSKPVQTFDWFNIFTISFIHL